MPPGSARHPTFQRWLTDHGLASPRALASKVRRPRDVTVDNLANQLAKAARPQPDVEWFKRRPKFVQAVAHALPEAPHGEVERYLTGTGDGEPRPVANMEEAARLAPEAPPDDQRLLASVLDSLGENRTSKALEGDRKQLIDALDALVARHEAEAAPTAGWLRRDGARTFIELVEKRWDEHGPWGAPAPAEAWAGRLPAQLFGDPGRALEEAERRIRKGDVEAVGALKTLLRVKPTDALAALGEAGMLRTEQDGIRPAPTPLVDAIVLGRVRQALRQTDIESWTRWLFDPSREALTAAVLRTLDWRQFLHAIDTLLSAYDSASLRHVVAVEWLFEECARRFAEQRVSPADHAVLHRLALAQQDALVQRSVRGPWMPATRGDAGAFESPAFVRDCWAWGFALPPPARATEQRLAWLFPGWCKPVPDDAPDTRHLPPVEGDNVLAGDAERVMALVEWRDMEPHAWGVLWPWAVLRALREGHPIPWEPSCERDDSPRSRRLVTLAEQLPPEQRGLLAYKIWSATIGERSLRRDHGALEIFKSVRDHAPIAGFAVQHTPTWAVAALLRRHGPGKSKRLQDAFRHSTHVPPDTLLCLVRGVLDEPRMLRRRMEALERLLRRRPPTGLSPELPAHARWAVLDGADLRATAARTEDDFRALALPLDALGPEHASTVALLAENVDRIHGEAAVFQRLWTLAPGPTRTRAHALGPDAPQLFVFAPLAEREELVRLLADQTGSLPDWACRWLAQVAVTRGPGAERAHRLRVERGLPAHFTPGTPPSDH